jgi:hypothetical protein
MITTDGLIEVQEQEDGTYIFPNDNLFEYTWALYVFKDGTAHLYTKRNPMTGTLLGKPQVLNPGKVRPLKEQQGSTLIKDLKLRIGEVFKSGKTLYRFVRIVNRSNKVYDEIEPL